MTDQEPAETTTTEAPVATVVRPSLHPWEHAHNFLVALRHSAWIILLIVVAVAVWSAWSAIKGQILLRQAQSTAATVPQSAPDDPLKKSIFSLGPKKHPLDRKVFSTAPKGPPPPFVQQPGAPTPTPSTPRPDLTTATAQTGPVATVFTPHTIAEGVGLESEFGISLEKSFLVTQRKLLGPSPYGVKMIATIPAGGGDVDIKTLSVERPRTGFHQEFSVAFGVVERVVPGEKTEAGVPLRLTWRPMRLGDWHFHAEVENDWFPGSTSTVGTTGRKSEFRVLAMGEYTFGDNNQ